MSLSNEPTLLSFVSVLSHVFVRKGVKTSHCPGRKLGELTPQLTTAPAAEKNPAEHFAQIKMQQLKGVFAVPSCGTIDQSSLGIAT